MGRRRNKVITYYNYYIVFYYSTYIIILTQSANRIYTDDETLKMCTAREMVALIEYEVNRERRKKQYERGILFEIFEKRKMNKLVVHT